MKPSLLWWTDSKLLKSIHLLPKNGACIWDCEISAFFSIKIWESKNEFRAEIFIHTGSQILIVKPFGSVLVTQNQWVLKMKQ
jgi:hypothetical protein